MTIAEEFRRLLRTAGYSLEGWRYAWREEKSLRQWAGVNLGSWIALALLRPPLAAVLAVILAGVLLLVAELINSSIEAVVDLVAPERHPLAKAAKDTASAAVAVLGLGFTVIWVFALVAVLA